MDRFKDSLTQTIGINLLYGLLSPRVDNWGHIGGLVGGALVALLLGPHLRPRRRKGETVLEDMPPVGILKYRAGLRSAQ